MDGVATIASVLNESNSQMRKYAVSVLAQLALSMSGQISMMSDQVLPRVIEMVKDPMPNVASAACYCLLKISTLYIGVQTLLANDITALLSKLLFDPDSNLDMKTSCAATLNQIYRFAPSTLKSPDLMKYLHSQLKSPDKKYKLTVMQLLDQWEEELPQIPISEKVKALITGLQNPIDPIEAIDLNTRISGTYFLLTELITSPEICLELVEAGGVEAILDNLKLQEDKEQRLSRYSFSILSIVADSNFGRKKILRFV